jgi:site-specific recombinase XerD
MSESPTASHDPSEVETSAVAPVGASEPSAADDAPALTPPLRANSALAEAIDAFHEYMVRKGFSENTIKAFQNDLKFLSDYLGRDTRLYHVTTQNLDEFLPWLSEQRKMDFSAKTQARRITTMKVFFGWLHGVGVIGTDPAEPLVQIQARTPLPTILRDSDVRTLLLKAQDISRDRQNPDARPYLLVSLLVQTGIKKAECARLLIDDIDIAQPSSPVLLVRYHEERYVHKNRALGLTATITPALQQYLAQYQPKIYSLTAPRATWSTCWRNWANWPASVTCKSASRRCAGRARARLPQRDARRPVAPEDGAEQNFLARDERKIAHAGRALVFPQVTSSARRTANLSSGLACGVPGALSDSALVRPSLPPAGSRFPRRNELL